MAESIALAPRDAAWLRCGSVTYRQYAPSSCLAIPGASSAIIDRLAIGGPSVDFVGQWRDADMNVVVVVGVVVWRQILVK